MDKFQKLLGWCPSTNSWFIRIKKTEVSFILISVVSSSLTLVMQIIVGQAGYMNYSDGKKGKVIQWFLSWLTLKKLPMLTLFSGFDICILMVSFFRSVGKTRVYWNQVCPASIFLFTIFLRIYTLDFRTPAFRRKRSYEIVSVSRSVCQ